MADRKISALSAITGANVVAADDYVPIVDVSEAADADKNKRILVSELKVATFTGTPAFRAHKNGSDQTGIADNTATTLTLGTEAYDIGGYFASNGWTPPAGKISMSARVHLTGTAAAGSQGIITILEAGVAVAQANFYGGANQVGMGINFETTTDGTKTYTVQVQFDVSSGTVTALGGATLTYFCGHWISP